ncbi:MAG TPA: ABC transporter substrate-binding protein [Desulfomonilaceae bacterium]|nr:ABC transporter substrate-binding protein [Desulfomonilaceae bacterium]
MRKSMTIGRGVACIVTIVVLGSLSFQHAEAFNEAPMLTKLVESGKLPSVDKRLPSSPMVVTPFDRNGEYGGVWRRAYTGLSDLVGARRVLYDPLVRWSPDYKIVPNLAEKWEVDDTGRVFTFHLVKGARWSDGQPFTADDIAFYFEDVLLNKELTPSIPTWIAPSGTPPKFTKIDDYTFQVEFAKPYSLFLEQLACPAAMAVVTKPKHYLMKFHKKYAKPEELEALMKVKKASTWAKLFLDASDVQHSLFTDPEMPSLCAWITKVPAPAKRFVMERNPYYWKVDPAGNQLPYIDTVVHDLQAEAQTVLLKAVAGEIDMQGRLLGGMQNSVLLLANLPSGKYKLVPKASTASVGVLLAPNLNHKDPLLKKILGDSRFRKALSYAINRHEINKIVFRGKGIPRQAAPLPESEFYSPSYEKAYLEFDQAKAAELLDEMGLKKGPGGKRMRPDGKPLQISLDVIVKIQSNVDTAEIIASNLKNLGIDTEVKSETVELFRQRTQSAAHDIALWSGDGGIECLLEPRWYFPFSTESLNATLYGLWFQSGGKNGEEPPADIKQLMETYQQILTTVSPDKKKELFKKIIDANEQNLWVIGLVHDPDDFYVVAKHMFNVPKRDFQSWIYPNPGPIHPEQFFFEQSK